MCHSLSFAFAAMIAASVAAVPALADTTPPAVKDADTVRIERLAGLGRLWGTVKFLHPYLAYRDIDWDAALVRAIPKVRAARSPEEYRAAIGEMLGTLGDPATTAIDTPSAAASPIPPPADDASLAPPVHRTVDGVAILHCIQAARLLASKGSSAVPSVQELGKAKGVIFDCRGGGASNFFTGLGSYQFSLYLRASVEGLVTRTVTLGSSRYREHIGYSPQVGMTSGGYRSGLVTVAPAIWDGRWRGGDGPALAFVIDPAAEYTLRELLSGLQTAGVATVVKQSGHGGADDDLNDAGKTVELPDGILGAVRVAEFVGANGETALRPDIEVAGAATAGADPAIDAALKSLTDPDARRTPTRQDHPLVLRGQWEKPYAETAYPDAEHRLLSLFRLWAVINYFFPYKELMDKGWAETLVEFVPRFEACRDALEYQETVLALAARLQDTHVGVSNAQAAEAHRGEFAPPITARSIESQTVIAALPDAEAAKAFGLRLGDVIMSVDDTPIEQLRASLGASIAASTPQSLRQRTDAMLLRGRKDSLARLRIKDADGALRDVEIPRTMPWRRVGSAPARTVPAVHEILPSGHGYIDLARLQYADADTAVDAVLDTPGVIFDMRGYPNGTAWAIAPQLAAGDRTITGALFRRPLLSGVDASDEMKTTMAFSQPIPATTKPRYRGKVVMLINEQAISQAEHTCLFFAAATDVTFIGSPTTGANGDVTSVVLPGGLIVSFTGQEVRHPDGRQLQRVGVQPHIRVDPTINGVRQGRDEVLEAAVAFLQQTLGR